MTNSSFTLSPKAADKLIIWHPADDDHLYRCFYGTECVVEFLTSKRGRVRDRGVMAAGKQLASKLDAFASGQPYRALVGTDSPPAFRKLRPTRPDGPNVWEMRTTDVRVFGWFPGPKNIFIGVCVALKKELLLNDGNEDQAAYQAFIDSVVGWRQAHDLSVQVWRKMQDDLPLHLKL